MTETDDKISKLYRAAHQEKPPTSIDESILQTARDSIERPARHNAKVLWWGAPVATAALVVLGITLTLDVTKEDATDAPMEIPSISPVSEQEADFTRALAKKKEYISGPTSSRQEEKRLFQGGSSQPSPAKMMTRQVGKSQARKNTVGTILDDSSDQKPRKRDMAMAKSERAKTIVEAEVLSESPTTRLDSLSSAVSGLAVPAKTRSMTFETKEYFHAFLEPDYKQVTGTLDPGLQKQLISQGRRGRPFYVMDDFNGDGVTDWAGFLLKKTGNVDLVVIMSNGDKYQHFVLASDIADNNRKMAVGVEVYPHGRVMGLPHDNMPENNLSDELTYPGIQLIYFGRSTVLFYWEGNKFQETIRRKNYDN